MHPAVRAIINAMSPLSAILREYAVAVECLMSPAVREVNARQVICAVMMVSASGAGWLISPAVREVNVRWIMCAVTKCATTVVKIFMNAVAERKYAVKVMYALAGHVRSVGK